MLSPEESIEECKEAFYLYDRRGDKRVECTQIGEVLRALGTNPTEGDITKIIKSLDPAGTGVKRVSFEEFFPIYQNLRDRQKKSKGKLWTLSFFATESIRSLVLNFKIIFIVFSFVPDPDYKVLSFLNTESTKEDKACVLKKRKPFTLPFRKRFYYADGIIAKSKLCFAFGVVWVLSWMEINEDASKMILRKYKACSHVQKNNREFPFKQIYPFG